MAKVLFILKRREDYDPIKHIKINLSTGLYNSAKFMDDMLQFLKIESKLIVVPDNNSIDKEVTSFKPDYVIIEALWVVPTKFDILQKLHPKVKWIIRLHSEMPFMAGEGIAMDWIGDYSGFRNIIIACNSPRMLSEIRQYVSLRNNLTVEQVNQKVIYLPNYYPQEYKTKIYHPELEYINVSCFGAVRPLKNHLVQAFAALEFARSINKKLRFHVNTGRIEMRGESARNNLRGLFEQLSHTGHQLINHEWAPREEFIKLCAKMDIGLQSSITETFNIVLADHVSQGVPIVACNEIPWADKSCHAIPVNSDDITRVLIHVHNHAKLNVELNQSSLLDYTNETAKTWYDYFRNKY